MLDFPGPTPPPDLAAAASVTDRGLIPDTLSDRGNGKLFVNLYRTDFRYVPEVGWYQWNGHRWQRDRKKTIMWAVGDFAEKLAQDDPGGEYARDELVRNRRRALSSSGMRSILEVASSAPDMVLGPDELDADPYVLCTPGGIVDLRTGALEQPDPTRHTHSRSTSVPPSAMPTPRWMRFLDDTFGDDTAGKQMQDYLHLLLGYSITGDVGAQVLPFLYGEGKNGKSVMLDTMTKLLGDYADAAPPGFLMARPFEQHPTDLAELPGRRIIVCSELKPGDKFDEARVKLLTGGDRLKARRMRQDFFGFQPTHKLWLLGNHRPEVVSGGFAFWRRMRLIPFERVISDDRKVNNLADVLVRHEGPGILAWLIDGAKRYLNGEKNLDGPSRVRLATTAYAETEDHMGRFITERCRVDHQVRQEQTSFYLAYQAWCRAEGINPSSARAFAQRIRDTLGMVSPKEMQVSMGKKYYRGIALTTTPEGTS
ncbi:phage/plasmid primase, P4 family (plasmid) [Streptomycetaceae bacterium NBC_01309]